MLKELQCSAPWSSMAPLACSDILESHSTMLHSAVRTFFIPVLKCVLPYLNCCCLHLSHSFTSLKTCAFFIAIIFNLHILFVIFDIYILFTLTHIINNYVNLNLDDICRPLWKDFTRTYRRRNTERHRYKGKRTSSATWCVKWWTQFITCECITYSP